MAGLGHHGRTASAARPASHAWAASDLADLLISTRFQFGNEKQLQDGISALFEARGIAHQREVTIGEGDVIDFVVGRIGLEVKVKQSLSQVTRQLHRYAQSPQIDTLVLVSSVMRITAPGMLPPTLNGKRLISASLIGSIF